MDTPGAKPARTPIRLVAAHGLTTLYSVNEDRRVRLGVDRYEGIEPMLVGGWTCNGKQRRVGSHIRFCVSLDWVAADGGRRG